MLSPQFISSRSPRGCRRARAARRGDLAGGGAASMKLEDFTLLNTSASPNRLARQVPQSHLRSMCRTTSPKSAIASAAGSTVPQRSLGSESQLSVRRRWPTRLHQLAETHW